MPIEFNRYKEAYLSEAKTYIKLMNKALLELEKNPVDEKSFQNIIRAIHTLKSLSGTMNYNQSMELCHAMEDLLSTLHQEPAQLRNCTDILFQCFDYLEENIKALTVNDDELDSRDLIQIIQTSLDPRRNSITDINTHDIKHIPPVLDKIQAIEVKVERLDKLMNLTEELLVNKMRFDLIREQSDNPELTPAVEEFARLITDLQYHVMQIRLVPIGFIFTRFLRMARDLAKQENKEVNLDIQNGEIEFDRLLIDEIGESIVHLIRNAIDHGIELPAIREKMNKPPTGTLLLRASRSNETALIEVSDDGAGLDIETIKNLAIDRKLVNENASLEEITEAIFSNLSTKKTVTSISGRGLGLAIVKQKIESIGGHIRVESTLGKGTTFLIEIPLSLAIIKSLFVKVANETYAIPLEFIERLLVVESSDFKGLFEQEAIIFEGDDIPVIRLSKLFGEESSPVENQPLVIIRKDDKRLALAVDSLLSTQEIVIKPITRSIKNNAYFSGAALIGSGTAILIVDIAYLLQINKKQPIPIQ